jgi:hypothetical protein
MITTNGDLILVSASMAVLAIIAWSLVHRRKRHDSRQRGGAGRRADPWTELQQRFIALVEQDERGGACSEELYRAVAHYRTVIGDATGGRDSELRSAGPKQIPLLF